MPLFYPSSLLTQNFDGHSYAFCLTLAEAADAELRGPSQLEWLARLEQERDNLRAALEWSLTSTAEAASRLAGALRWFWYVRGPYGEGRNWLMKALHQTPEQYRATRARALEGASLMTLRLADTATAYSMAEESAAIFRELGDKVGQADALSMSGGALLYQAEITPGLSKLAEALALYREAGNRWGIARGLCNLAIWRMRLGDREATEAMIREGMRILEEVGDRWILMAMLIRVGPLACESGDYTSAQASAERSLTLARELGDPDGIESAFIILGLVSSAQGNYPSARSHFREALRVCREYIGRPDADLLWLMGENDIAAGDLSSARSHIQEGLAHMEASGNKELKGEAKYYQGLLAYYEGDMARAVLLLEEGMAILKKTRDRMGLGSLLVMLGRAKRAQGDVASATALIQEGLILCQQFNHKPGIATALEGLAGLAIAENAGQAARLFGAADAIRGALGTPLSLIDRPAYEHDAAAAQAQLGEAAFAGAWAAGQSLTLEQAIARALQDKTKAMPSDQWAARSRI
jgi:tetratricopeptide (TPR) repeat protein